MTLLGSARLGIAVILLSLLGFAPTAHGDENRGLDLRIRFLDEPPYYHCWLPWVDDQFRFELEIKNLSDSVYAIWRATPCDDCNPRFFLESITEGKEATRLRGRDALYPLTDAFTLDLPPSESYRDTVDVAKWTQFDLVDGVRYRFWIEFRSWPKYTFKDTTRTTPIWESTLVSDTLEFTY